MAIWWRCERICSSDSGSRRRRRMIVKRMMARPPAMPRPTDVSRGAARSRSPCSMGWTMNGFQIGSRKSNG
jgi:hypothetical protein